jgi:hypothetical protein
MALRVVSGDLIDNKSIASAKELDKRIRECLRDYVQLGKLLMEMRDGQSYRLVGPYDTFEDYCKDVEGLAYSTAREKITAYLVHRAIEENLGDKNLAPSTEAQVRQLFIHDGAIAKFKTEKRVIEKRDGTKTPVEVPVAVSNPKKVADQWAAIVKAHEAVVARSERLHEEKVEQAKTEGKPAPTYRRPKLTGNFVVNELPSEYQPERKTSGEAHHFVRWIGSVMKGVEAIEKMREQGDEKWNRLVANPDRKKLTKTVVLHLIDDLTSSLTVLQQFKDDVSNEFEI